MKKAAIILCAAVYAIAIIVVAFLGYQAEIKNPPVYADDIVLVQEVPYEKKENGTVIYTIKQVPAANEGEEANKYKYEVEIKDFEFLYYVLDAKLSIQAKPVSFKVNEETKEQLVPDEKKVNYFTSSSLASIDEEGNVTFSKYKDDGSIDFVISTVDGSNINIYVRIYW